MELEKLSKMVVKPRLNDRFKSLPNLSVNEDIEEFDSSLDAPDVELKTVAGLPCVILYKDSKGNLSQRLISCKRLAIKADKKYLDAYCHQVKAFRTFRIDRIFEIFDAQTGESLTPAESYFSQFGIDEKTKSGLSWGLSVQERTGLIAFLNALIFIARCDKEYHPLERHSLENAIVGYWLRQELKGEPDCDAIINYADRLSPDGETFWTALHNIKRHRSIVSHFKRSAGDIIEADGFLSREENYWAVEIEQFFSS